MSKTLIIIPTYNERENIEAIIEKVFSLSQPFDVLVIDDNSPDSTAKVVESLQTKAENKNRLHLISRKKTGS